MTGFLKGAATAMITPFTESGEVDLDSFGRMIDYQIENGTDALVILGTTGEPATMTEEEKQTLMRFSVEKTAHRAKVIFGTGSNCTKKAIEASRTAEALGADGLLVVTPYYNKCTQNGIFEYYKSVCDSVSIPVICYNVPSRTGVNILPATMDRLADIPNMAGIKEASGNMSQVCETMRLIRGRCDLYSGEDNLNVPILAIGGTAVISVASNLVPALVKEVCTAMEEGDYQRANALQERLFPLNYACFLEVNPIPAKAGMEMLGFSAGVPRPPLTEMEEAHKAILREKLVGLGMKVVK